MWKRVHRSRVRRRRTTEATPLQRLECLRELHRLERERRVIARLLSGNLPMEIVMHILAQVVLIRTPKLHLWHEISFREATTALIGRYHGAAAVHLYSLIEQALLENANIHLDVSFARRDKHGADVVAQLPPFMSRLPYRIRHLEFTVKVEIPLNRLNYPIDIFRVTRGIGSLREHFINLHSLTLVLNLSCHGFNEDVLNQLCYNVYSRTTSFWAILVRLIEAVREQGPGRSKAVRIEYEDDMHRKYHGHETIIWPTTSSAEDVLRQAYQGTLNSVTSFAQEAL